MHKIIVRKRLNTLNKVSCSCGYIAFATTGQGIDYLALMHYQKNDKATLETYVEDELEDPDKRRAKPGRHNGNVQGGDSEEGNYAYSGS